MLLKAFKIKYLDIYEVLTCNCTAIFIICSCKYLQGLKIKRKHGVAGAQRDLTINKVNNMY